MKKSKVFKVYLIYFICMLLFCLLRIGSSFGMLDFLHPDIADIVYTAIIQIGIILVLPMSLYTLFLHNKTGFVDTFRDTQLNGKINFKVILISLGLGLLAFFVNIAISTLFNGILSFFGYSQPVSVSTGYEPMFPNWATFLIQLTTVAILPAICEEFLHRGVLLNGLKEIGIKKAILISSLMFGLLHFNINQFFYATILGMLMALVSVVSKSIYPAMIIHFTNNAISVYLSSAESYGWFGKNFYNYLNNFLQSNNAFLTFLACFAFLVLVVVLLIYLVSKLFRISTLNRVQKVIDSMYTADDRATTNSPIVVEKSKMLQEMLENNTTLNLNYEEMKSPIDVVLPKQKNIYKPTIEDNLFLISSCVLGGLVTLFTFIWGLLW